MVILRPRGKKEPVSPSVPAATRISREPRIASTGQRFFAGCDEMPQRADATDLLEGAAKGAILLDDPPRCWPLLVYFHLDSFHPFACAGGGHSSRWRCGDSGCDFRFSRGKIVAPSGRTD